MSHPQFYDCSYDRYIQRTDDSKSHKLKNAYWTTKQAMIKKFGRKQDENIVASDSDIDSKLELLKSIQVTCSQLNSLLSSYQNIICYLAQAESEMGRFLKNHCMEDRTRAGKIMCSVGKALSHSAQQRLSLRNPLERLHQEVKTFRQRAISDTVSTLKRMEASRTDYRGALLWMKHISEELDPDTYKQMEKFRCVQAQVRKSKAVFDRLKIDSMQKIDLLAASRCNMLSHVLAAYQNGLVTYLSKTSRAMVAVADRFKGYQYYEFAILKHLRPESMKLASSQVDSDGEATIVRSESPICFHDPEMDDLEANGHEDKEDDSEGVGYPHPPPDGSFSLFSSHFGDRDKYTYQLIAPIATYEAGDSQPPRHQQQQSRLCEDEPRRQSFCAANAATLLTADRPRRSYCKPTAGGDATATEGQLKPTPSLTEEELDNQLDEIFRADEGLSDSDSILLQHLPSHTSNAGGVGSDAVADGSELISGNRVPPEHRDLLVDLFCSDEPASQQILTAGPGPSNSTTDALMNSDFVNDWEATFRANKQQPDVGSSSTHWPLGELWDSYSGGAPSVTGTSVSSILPSQLLDLRDGADFFPSMPVTSDQNSHNPAGGSGNHREPSSTIGGSGGSATSLNQGMQTANQPGGMEAWMRLFTDLDPLGNPDKISKNEGQISDV